MDPQTRYLKIRELETELHDEGTSDERGIELLAQIRKLKAGDKKPKAPRTKKEKDKYMTVLGGYVLDMSKHGALVGTRDEEGNIIDRQGKVIGHLPKKESNPEDGGEAAEVFEEFHGYPSSGTTSLAEQEQYRDELAQLGTLEELEVCIDGTDKVVPISFDHHTKLCVTTDKKQMYLLGGNQELDLDELVEAGALDESEKEKDFVAIGPVHSITYFAKKQHLSGPKNGVPYIHEFGEEDGVYPELVYDRLNKTCSLVGGSYTVEDVGIKN